MSLSPDVLTALLEKSVETSRARNQLDLETIVLWEGKPTRFGDLWSQERKCLVKRADGVWEGGFNL